MSKGLSNSFWGLERRFPRFASLPPVSPLEGMAIGSLVGCFLVSMAFAIQLVWFDQIQQFRPFVQSDYLYLFSALYGIPVIFGLLLYAVLRSTQPDPDVTDEVRFHGLRVLLALLREKQRLRVIDWFLILILPVLAGIEVQFFGVSLYAHWREWPVGIAALLTALLLLSFRRNPFVPVGHPIDVPDWVDSLLPMDTDVPSHDEPRQRRRSFCRQHGIVDRDDCTDPNHYFSYTFEETLPEEIRQIGIQCAADTLRQMALFLSNNGGAHYQKNEFQEALRMIDPFSGCLEGVGAVETRRLVAQILTRAKFAGWSRYRLAEAILHFVQRVIDYAEDELTTGQSEYGRFPLQTLADGKGDCECTSILCCALLSYTGFESALVYGKSACGTGHVLCALRPPPNLPAFITTGLGESTSTEWLYGETTLDAGTMSWQTSIPGSLAEVIRVVPVPAQNL